MQNSNLPVGMTKRTLRITAKRQATLPIGLCDELGVGPGDTLSVERVELDGEAVWVLRAPLPDWGWAGSLREYAEAAPHDWNDVDSSIEQGWAGDPRP